MAYTTINKSSDYFDTRTYSASGAGSISDVSFQPDFLWFKNRTVVGDHGLMDSVRGINKISHSNDTLAQITSSATNDFTAFTSNGFTYGASAQLDTSNGTPVTWLWKAGTTSGIATNGATTITPQSYSFNQTSGMSIINYDGNNTAGAKVAHGLGATPDMMIVKAMNSTAHWAVYHKSMGNTHYMQFDTNQQLDDAGVWNDTSPDSVNFTVGISDKTNTVTYIAYCFAEKQGFSKFGSYKGTGSSTGTPFIYTGFKPAFVMTKVISGGNDAWSMTDIPRDNAVGGGGNATGARVTANETAAESTNTSWASIQKYSNGFSPQGTDSVTNAAGYTYIYMAFAKAPLVGSNNVPANAR